MTGTTILTTLFGAALVAVGVLVAALADRIRGLRVTRDRAIAAPRAAAPAIEVVETPAPRGAAKTPRPETKAQVPLVERMAADDVIAALVATGYKKTIATEAVWGCGTAERATPERWTAAALRRCAQGGAS